MADRSALAAGGAVLVWSTNALAAGVALEHLSVMQVLALQFGAAATVFLVVRGRRRSALRPRAAAVGIVGLVGAIVLQYVAFATAPLIGANAIAYAWPVMVAAWLARGGAAGRVPLALALLGFTGVVLILSQGGNGAGEADAPLLGYAAALGSALAMAWYSLAAGSAPGSRADLLLVATAGGAAATIPLAVAQGGSWAPAGAVLLGLYTGVGPMAAGYALWTSAMSHPDGARLAPLAFATPLLSTLVLVVAGQRLSPLGFAGCALIVVCAAGALLDRRGLAPKATARRRAAEALLVERGVDAHQGDLGDEARSSERVDAALAQRRLG
jgi:drug/metabolite transporter (DMT)-like permease